MSTTTTTIDIAGLKLVAEAVRNAPENRFDMATWDCGTTACAIGWFCRANPDDALVIMCGDPYLRGRSASSGDYIAHNEPVAERFGISKQEAKDLFCPYIRRESRESFLGRLESFIAANET